MSFILLVFLPLPFGYARVCKAMQQDAGLTGATDLEAAIDRAAGKEKNVAASSGASSSGAAQYGAGEALGDLATGLYTYKKR